MWFTKVSIKNPIFAVMIMVALVVLGIMGYKSMPVDQYPEITFPIIVVQTNYDGAAPTSVENDVSRPIEEALNTVSGIQSLESRSYEGVSVVIAQFDLSTDIKKALQDVRGKIDEVKKTLRDEVDEPVITQSDPTAAPIMILGVSGAPSRSLRDLTDIADNIILKKIQTVDGVGSVNLLGGLTRQVNINLDPAKMESLGVGVNEISAAIRANNQELPAGIIDNQEKQIILQVKGRLTSLADFRRTKVATRGGLPVYLEQLATVEDGSAERSSAALKDGQATLALSIVKSSGTNTLDVANGVRAVITDLGKELPDDIEILTRQDQSVVIKNNVDDVIKTIIEGAILTIMIVFLFLHSWRSTVITALTLPVSMVGTFGIISLLGYTINTMTLMALSLSVGLLIDDAIVVRENIVRHVQKGKDHYRASLEGTSEIGLAVLATTLCIVAVFLPLGFMDGIIGQFFHSFSITIVVAVLLSMFVSFTLDPMLSSVWFDPDAEKPLEQKRGAKFLKWFDRQIEDFSDFYQSLLKKALNHRIKTLLIAFATFALSIFLVSYKIIGSEFIPQSDSSEMNVRIKTPIDTTLEQTSDKTIQIQNILKSEFTEVEYTFARIGSGTSGSNVSNIYVKLVDKSKRSRSVDEIKGPLRARLMEIPGISISKVSGQEGGPSGSNKAVVFNIKGPDLNRLEAYSQEALLKLKNTPGIMDLESSVAEKKPAIDLRINAQRAADLGANTGDLAKAVSGLVTGTNAGTWRAPNDEDYNIKLRLKESERTRPSDVSNLRIATGAVDSAGTPVLVRIGDVAELVQSTTATEIVRENLVRRIQIDANPLGRTSGELSADISETLKTMTWEPGYSFEATGDSKDMKESIGYAMIALMLGILFIYMVLASQFNSFLQPIAIMSTLPLSLIGVFAALLLFKSTLNMFSMVGFVLLMGLVTKNAILLIDFINQSRAEGASRIDAITLAARIRLRPILMTTLAMIFGMLPLGLALGEGSEQRAPMGQAVIGGTITSTLLTLVVVPVVYTYLDDFASYLKNKFSKTHQLPESHSTQEEE